MWNCDYKLRGVSKMNWNAFVATMSFIAMVINFLKVKEGNNFYNALINALICGVSMAMVVKG